MNKTINTTATEERRERSERTPPSASDPTDTKHSSRKEFFMSKIDSIASIYHRGSRRVKRALTFQSFRRALLLFANLMLYTTLTLVVAAITNTLISFNVYLAAAFIAYITYRVIMAIQEVFLPSY